MTAPARSGGRKAGPYCRGILGTLLLSSRARERKVRLPVGLSAILLSHPIPIVSAGLDLIAPRIKRLGHCLLRPPRVPSHTGRDPRVLRARVEVGREPDDDGLQCPLVRVIMWLVARHG